MLRRQIVIRSVVLFGALGLVVAFGVAHPATMRAGGGCHVDDGAGFTEGPATVVRMDVCSFEPTVVRVPVGTNVRFLNTAQNEHAVSGRANTWGSADIMAPGTEFSQRFTMAGTFPYTCPLHPGMVGAVIVGGVGQAVAPVTEVGADVAPAPANPAPAPADVAASDQNEAAVTVPVAFGGAAVGSFIGLLVGLLIARRRPTSTPVDAVPTSPALGG